MNRQGKQRDGKWLSRGIEWTNFFGDGTGYTANPIRGCEHKCEFEMPDGTRVICYAKSQHDRLHGRDTFETITWHPGVLEEVKKHKTSAGIFFDSMSDVLGNKVERQWIEAMIGIMHDCPQHVFFLLTKNPTRLIRDKFQFPVNCLLGMSSPPTFMFGKRMSDSQRFAWFDKGIDALMNANAEHVWLSLEPLTMDLSDTIRDYRHGLSWAVIGAGSDGAKKYQPDGVIFQNTLDALGDTPVFYKGNLDKAKVRPWREEFPEVETKTETTLL